MAELQFDAETHTYTLRGVRIPSVTEILDQVVPKPWTKAVWHGYRCGKQGLNPDESRNKAANLGTQVHLALAARAGGETVDPFDYPDEAHGFLRGVERFIETHGPEFIDSEKKTYSTRYSYAGTLDAFVKFTRGPYKARTARIDLKTGRVYKDSHFPQLVAYEEAEFERGQPLSNMRFVLKVTPGGTHKLIECTDTFSDFEVLLNHYRSVQARARRAERS